MHARNHVDPSVARPYLARLRDEFSELSWLGQVRPGKVILIVAEAPGSSVMSRSL